MTVNTTGITSGPYTGNGVTTAFSYTFRITDKSQVSVYETTDAGVVSLLTVDTDYTVAGIGDDDGGTITRVAGALPTDYKWFIRSNYAETQLTAFQSQGAYFPDIHEDMADKLTFLIQQIRDATNRSIRLDKSLSNDSDFAIDSNSANRSGNIMQFNASGGLSLVSPSTLYVSTPDEIAILNTIASLQANTSATFTYAYVAGHSAAGDGGGGFFWLDTTDTSTADDNGINIVDSKTVRDGTWKRIYEGSINAKWFGAKGDNSTDDTDAITSALAAAAGGSLFFPAGTYVVPIDLATMFTPGANTTVLGEGPGISNLKFNMTDTTTRTLFAASNNYLQFQDIKIQIGTSVTGGIIIGFQWSANNLSFYNVEIDGAVTDDISASHQFMLIKCNNSGTFGNLQVGNCYWHDTTRHWLRENASTATVSQLRFTSNRFERSEASMFALNSPNGTITDVVFSANNFLDPYIDTVQNDSYFIGPQCVDCTINANTFSGDGHECIHVEEQAFNIAILGNAINMNCAGRAIYVSDNNQGGAAVTPARIQIIGNTIKRTDSGKVGVGIELVNDGGDEPLNYGIINGNNISGWNYGMVNGNNQDDITVAQGNIIHDCTEGLRSSFGMPGFEGNTIAGCTRAIDTISGGGMFGKNTYYGNGTLFSPTSGEISIAGASFRFDRTDFTASGNTDFFLLPAGSAARIFGTMKAHAYANDTSEDYEFFDDVLWDGSSLSSTAKFAFGGGQITLSLVVTGGNLYLRAANSSSLLSNGSVYVDFDGMAVAP